MAHTELHVRGMDCASCADAIEGSLKRLEGIRDVQVDVVGGRVRVEHIGAGLTRRDLTDAVHRAGYSVEPAAATPASPASIMSPDAPAYWARHGRFVMTVVAGAALGIALLLEWTSAAALLVTAMLAVSTLAGGWYVVPRGARAARAMALDMNFLMSVAAIGAWLIGEQGEAAATLFLFAVAELLESYSMDRARNAIKSLMDLSPQEATVIRDDRELCVPVGDIEIGETVLVRPGEKVPVDGAVVSGRSSINQAPITGESMPVDKEAPDDVFAGSLNGHGALHVRSSKVASDTTLARIIHAVEEAQVSRAPTQTFVDRFARVYTPAIVALAILIAVVPPAAGLGTWDTWVYRALAMLVIACPCALVISTPVSIVSGLTAAARGGVLIKGGAHLESAGALTIFCFDKTGTLTEGMPAVTDVLAFGGRSEADVLQLAAGVERHSEHPLAKAILQRAAVLGIEPAESRDFEALPGRGARALVNGDVVYLGNQRLGETIDVGDPLIHATLERFESEGRTAVLVATRGSPLGIIAIADRVRAEAREALDALRANGIRQILMLTGDNEGTARAIAGPLGITDVRAALLPADKLRIVRDIESSGNRIAFVGDGVNDSPALAAATVGIAMGTAGTDVALETADIALMGDDLRKLSFAIQLSRLTRAIIKQNIWFALSLKAVFLVLAATGVATLWMAVAADMGASLLVVTNGLRPLRNVDGHRKRTATVGV